MPGGTNTSTHPVIGGITVTQLDNVYVSLRPTFAVSRSVGDLDEVSVGSSLEVAVKGFGQTTLEKIKLP